MLSLRGTFLLLLAAYGGSTPDPVGTETLQVRQRIDAADVVVDRDWKYKIQHLPSPSYCQSMTEQECEQYDREWGGILKNRKFLTRRGRESLNEAEKERRRKLSYSELRELQTGGVPKMQNTGTFNILVCLVQWSNHPNRNTVPASDYELLFNTNGRDATKYPGGTVRDYFETMSYGQLTINAHVADWAMSTASEQTYTGDGGQGRTDQLQEAFVPILDALDNTGFDFSTLDADYNRVIDFVVFLHSGYDGTNGGVDCETGIAAAQRIASHARSIPDGGLWTSKSGFMLGSYVVAPAYRGVCDLEIGQIGTIVHEMIHPFGIPDLYDVEGPMNPGGNLGGIDKFDLMANPSGQSGGDLSYPGHISAWTRQEMGWVVPTEITADGTYTARPVELFPDVFIINKGYLPGEYLLIENRQAISGAFDENFFTPGGITIYHIDTNIWSVYTSPSVKGNYPRGGPFLSGWPSNGYHYPVALLQADGLYELEQALNGGHSADLYNSETQSLGPGNGSTFPNTDSYAFGVVASTGITISNFRTDGQTMTFDVSGLGAGSPTDPPVATPTDVPVAAPAAAPTDLPVATPTDVPVAAPAAAPTDPPVATPTDLPAAPVAAPTDPPVATPTDLPVAAPVAAPTSPTVTTPTNPPDMATPTDPPVLAPTSPTDVPANGTLPPNDDCANAVAIDTAGTIVDGSTTGSTPETSITDAACGIESSGVWYVVTGTGSALQATTCLPGTDHPTTIHVFSGDCGNLTCMSVEGGNSATCADTTVSSNSATLNWLSESGVEYLILVGTREDLSGSFQLKVEELIPTSNDECSSSLILSPAAPVDGNTTSATNDFSYGEYCGLPLDTAGVWYSMQGNGSGISITTCLGNSYDSAISVFTGSCDSLQCLTGVSSRDPSCDSLGVTATWLGEEGVPYFIYVHGNPLNSMGVFKLTMDQFDVTEANQFCAQALPAPLDGTRIEGSTQAAANPAPAAPACDGVENTHPGLWYTFEGTGDSLAVSACTADGATDFDPSVSIFTGGCGELSCLAASTFAGQACSDAETTNRTRSLQGPSPADLTLDTEVGVTYHLLVHGQSPTAGEGGVGSFQLFLTGKGGSTTAPPKGDSALGRGDTITKPTDVNTPVTIDLGAATVEVLFNPKHGTVEVPSDAPGTVVYTPEKGYAGSDRFSVKSCKEDGGSCDRVPIVVEIGSEADRGGDNNGGTTTDTQSSSSSNSKNALYALLLLLLLPVLWFFRKRIFICGCCNRNKGADDEKWDPTRPPSDRKMVPEGPFRDEDLDEEEGGNVVHDGYNDVAADNDDDDDDDDENDGDDEGDDDDDDEDDDENDGDEEDDDNEDDDDDDDDDDVTDDALGDSDDEEMAESKPIV